MKSKRAARTLVALVLLIAQDSTAAEQNSASSAEATPDADLEEIVVNAQRMQQELLRIPGAVGVVDQGAIQRAQRQLTFAESLGTVPGVFIQNQSNFAQDTRISIRGFGARSAFGVRGIRLVVDGIPLTLPDGQTQLDSVDFASAERIEVLRGPSSSLYGSSAGGVILVSTEDGPEIPTVSGRAAFGSHGYRSYQAKGGGELGKLNSFLSLSRQEIDGYRDHSRMENLIFSSKFRYSFDDDSQLTALVSHVHAPQADDPGGLTAAQVADDRRQARLDNQLYDAGEKLDHTTFGLTWRKAWKEGQESHVSNYYSWREFENKLPFSNGGAVDFDRFFVGGALRHEVRSEIFGLTNRLLGGVDVDAQLDDRRRFVNDFGSIGAETLKQDERVIGTGVYLVDALDLTDQLQLTGSIRYDYVGFDVDDHFISDGDQSGDIDFNEPSYMGALLWSPTSYLVPYFKVASSFETPTTTEFANPDPDAGGFNPDLEAQKALEFEFGLKGLLPARFRYEIAAFHSRSRKELIPFELDDQPGRTFYQNAGRSTRRGVELSLAGEPLDGLTASLSYTFSDFEFDDFDLGDGCCDGNRAPGIPKHQVFFELAYEHHSGLFIRWNLHYVDARYANDANTASSGDYLVSNLHAGYALQLGKFELTPFFGLGNIGDEKYIDNLRLNAFGGRYYEPAPEFNAYGGLSLEYRFGAAPRAAQAWRHQPSTAQRHRSQPAPPR